MTIPTLDLFFCCEVASTAELRAGDDAAECLWVSLHELSPQQFGLHSISLGVERFLREHAANLDTP
jgi:hypothetical protein